MKESTPREIKTVTVWLRPGDRGPLCPYSPYCSPSDRNLTLWRRMEATMRETELEPTRDEEKALIEAWVVQLVQRELGLALQDAEERAGYPLEITLTADAAHLIHEALATLGPESPSVPGA